MWVTRIKQVMGADFLRLDKFLQVSRLVKRRTLAKTVCTQGRVQVNGRVAKAGTEVKPGDKLQLDFGRRVLVIEVLAVPEAVKTGAAAELYRVIEEKKREPGEEKPLV
jgi:ribosomal 50S subunit-recycling heat shock protein